MTEQDKYHEPIGEEAVPAAAVEQPAAIAKEAPQAQKEVPAQPETKVEAKPQAEASQSSKEVASAPSVLNSAPVSNPIPQPNNPASGEQVKRLTQVAFDQGLTEAIEEAKKLNNPYILDEFHDALIDDFYKKLVEAGKLEQK